MSVSKNANTDAWGVRLRLLQWDECIRCLWVLCGPERIIIETNVILDPCIISRELSPLRLMPPNWRESSTRKVGPPVFNRSYCRQAARVTLRENKVYDFCIHGGWSGPKHSGRIVWRVGSRCNAVLVYTVHHAKDNK